MQQYKRTITFIISLLVITSCFWYAETFAFRKGGFQYEYPFSIADTLKKDSLTPKLPVQLRGRRPKPQKPKAKVDTLKKKDTIKKPKGALEDVVKYKAKDSIVFNKATHEIILHNETNVQYTDIDITAGIDVINFQKGEVYAGRLKDSLGEYSQHPVFKQGNDVIEPDSILYNSPNQPAITPNPNTTQHKKI